MNAVTDSGAGRQPLITVIVPAWNAEVTLGETLGSVARQTYGNLEIIIVDDGSTDATAAVAERFCATEPRARLIRKDNRGVASARNRGISESQGEWIAPIDADDLWHPKKIEKQIAAALSAPERPGYVYCWYRLIDESGRVTASGPRLVISGPAFNQLAYCNAVENGSALLLSREAVLEVGGYDESLRAEQAEGCEDVMIQLGIARAHPVAVVPEHLVGHRRHASNMSSDSDQIVRSWRIVYRRMGAEKPSLPPRVFRWVEGKCSFDVAEQRALSGQYLGASAQLLRALRLDPVRCGFTLVYRIARSVVRRLSRHRAPAELPHFNDVDPSKRLGSDPHELTPVFAWLENLNRARLTRLAAIDRGNDRPAPDIDLPADRAAAHS